jgi:DNA-binding NtrC family response regulator
MRWCDELTDIKGAPPIVIFSIRSSIRLAILAERMHAVTVLTPPLKSGQLRDALRRSRERAAVCRPVPLPDFSAEPVGREHLVGQSVRMAKVRRMIARLAPCDTTVLITGESGTGKELIARALHDFGARAAGPFVAINCAAMPETLLESELFGHERGAFTGALMKHPGHFERASGGTLFLDEIADMSPSLQAKILRVLQERRVVRVGGSESFSVDVRLIAATNRDLRTAVDEGKFREDLYYRLAVVSLGLPRLAEREDDILLLTSYFVRRFETALGKRIRYICENALFSLRSRAWRGNVRELRNQIERAVLLADGDTLTLHDLSSDEWSVDADPPVESPGAITLEEMEAQHIARVLREFNGSVTESARVLGIHRNSLARKIRRYG